MNFKEAIDEYNAARLAFMEAKADTVHAEQDILDQVKVLESARRKLAVEQAKARRAKRKLFEVASKVGPLIASDVSGVVGERFEPGIEVSAPTEDAEA